MKLVTFQVDGATHTGALRSDSVADLGPVTSGTPGLRSILQNGSLNEVAEAVERCTMHHAVGSVRLLPPVADPGKIICVGVNYRTHRDETGNAERQFPTIFNRFPDTQIGAHDDIVRPPVTDRLDYEGELAVIIGATADNIPPERAFDVVAGYSVYNDVTVRDWQKHTTQWTPGKNFAGTGVFGPALVTPDEIGPVGDLTLTTTVNGEVRQHATLNDLIFDIPELISYITTFTVLAPGDVIVTGTPGGVGQFMDPPSFLRPGDEVQVDVPGIGTIRNTVTAPGHQP